jgi:hypothetical protein
VVQVVEHLPSQCEALSSKPNTSKKTKTPVLQVFWDHSTPWGNWTLVNQQRVRLLDFFFWRYWSLNSGPTPGAIPPALFVKGFYQVASLSNYFSGLALNCGPLISFSWVARITGVSHQLKTFLRWYYRPGIVEHACNLPALLRVRRITSSRSAWAI